jgi:hypothetical protein
MAQAVDAAGIEQRRYRLRRDPAQAMSCQAKRVNSGVRPTVLYREAETGKRCMRGLEASGVLAAVYISNRGGNRIPMRDVVGRSAGELIRFLNHIIVMFEQR